MVAAIPALAVMLAKARARADSADSVEPQPAPTDRKRVCPGHGEWDPVVRDVDGTERWRPICPSCAAERGARALVDRAAIPERFRNRRIDTYRANTDGQRRALDAAREYVDDMPEVMRTGRCLVLLGRPGTGKTHLACAIVWSAVATGYSTLYATVMDVIRAVRDTWRRDADLTEAEVLGRFARIDLLVLDEVGVQYGTDAERVTLFEVINKRYLDCRPTIIVSNESHDGIKAYLGERSFDRLREGGGRLVVFDWDSYRTSATVDRNGPLAGR